MEDHRCEGHGGSGTPPRSGTRSPPCRCLQPRILLSPHNDRPLQLRRPHQPGRATAAPAAAAAWAAGSRVAVPWADAGDPSMMLRHASLTAPASTLHAPRRLSAPAPSSLPARTDYPVRPCPFPPAPCPPATAGPPPHPPRHTPGGTRVPDKQLLTGDSIGEGKGERVKALTAVAHYGGPRHRPPGQRG